MNLGGYRHDTAREIYERVLGHEQGQPPLDNARHRTVHNPMYFVKLLADLDTAEDALEGYTQSEAKIVRYKQPVRNDLDMELSAQDDSKVTVTNRFTTFSASEDDIILVIRNGSEWTPLNAGTGGTHRIRFTIDEVVCAEEPEDYYCLVEWTHYSGGCQEPPGQESDGRIAVYDTCLFTALTSEQLLGRTGSATYWFVRLPEDDPDAPCTALWMVDDLCDILQCSDEEI